MGLGGYPATDRSSWACSACTGTYQANMAMPALRRAPRHRARGSDDRVIGNPTHFGSVPRKIIHVDIDPSSISKRVKVDVPIVAMCARCSMSS